MIELQQVNKTYSYKKANAVHALVDVSLRINEGELTAIVGKSGSGKSTLLNVLGCMDTFETGTYLFDGKDITHASGKKLATIRNQDIGFVVQDFALIADDTALQNVMLPFYFSRRTSLREAKVQAMHALQQLGMDSMAQKPVNKLSGGQKQRVSIARAIVHQPRLILADEPTGALDSRTAEEIMGVFQELHQNGSTVIIVTHDPGIAQQCSRIIEIQDGKIAGA